MTLPDTPLNRRLLRDWSEQDSRGGRLRTTLFSAEVEAVTPEPADPTTFSTTTMTFNLQPAGTLAEDEQPDQNVIDELIISRMISGSSSSRTETSDSIFLNTMGVLNIENEFLTTFEAKKNRCASVPALYEFVKKKHPDWMWPKGEKGDKIRDNFAKLCSNFRTEYSAKPKLVAAFQIYSLYRSDHKDALLSDFHSSLCYATPDFLNFQDLCAHGSSDDSVLRFCSAVMLPCRFCSSHWV